jgi:hypothetical protein
MKLLRPFSIFLILLGNWILFGCQQHDDAIREKKIATTNITKIEIRATNLLVEHRVPLYDFSMAVPANYFRREITDPDTLYTMDSVLSHIGGEIDRVKQEYIAGIIAYHEHGQDSIGFGYRGISYKGKLYQYTANEALVRLTAALLPDINKYTLLLGLNPDNQEYKAKLEESIHKAVDVGSKEK